MRGTRCKRGQALVEFTILSVVLLLLAGVAVDIGRLFVLHQALSEAAREGTIYGSVAAGQDEQIRQRVVASSPNLGLSAGAVTISYDEAPCSDGDNFVHVTVAKDIPLIGPLTSAFVPTFPLQVTESALIIAPACP